jgi:hypothetical protein
MARDFAKGAIKNLENSENSDLIELAYRNLGISYEKLF